MCKSYCFLGESSCFAFLVPNHYKNRFFGGILKTRFSAFWAQKCRVVLCPTTHKDKTQKKTNSRVSYPFFLSLSFSDFLSVCLSIISFLSFLPSFLFLLSLFPSFVVVCPRTPKYLLQKNLLFPVFVCPFFLSLSFSDFRSFFLSFCLSFLFLPSFLSLLSFLLFSSFFHSFLLSFPSFASKQKEEREREREREQEGR